VYAGFASAIYGQLVAGLLGGAAHPGSGPRPSVCLVLAGLVALLAADPVLAPAAGRGAERVVALAGMAVVLAGVLQVVLGAIGGGLLARYVPYPFIAGFMCGASALIIMAQFTSLTGISYEQLEAGLPLALDALQPGTLLVGLATAVLIWTAVRLARRVPAALAGLVGGTLLYYALRYALPDAAFGPVIGHVPAGLPSPGASVAVLDIPWSVVKPHVKAIVSAAAVMAVIGSLDGLFAAVAIDHATDGRHVVRREMLAHGLANIVSGSCGGAPVVLSRAQAIASWNAGGRTRYTALIAAVLLALVLVLGSGVLALVPIAVLAAVMLMVGIGLMENWTEGLVQRMRRRGARRDHPLLWSVVTVVLVALTAIFAGFMAAMAVGFLMSGLLFFIGMNRSLVRSVVDATVRPSRRIWGGEDALRLHEVRKRIRIVEMEGALFFGSAERLTEEVEPLAGVADAVVLDFRRVTAIDATGALLLERLVRRLATRKTKVLLGGVTRSGRHGSALVAHGAFRDASARPWFPDADQAVEWAENDALERLGRTRRGEVPLESFPLFEGLRAPELAIVGTRLQRRVVEAGHVLFQENDPGDRLCLLAQGAVEITITTGAEQRVRIVTMAEGSLFGEATLLDGRARSATAKAVEESVVYELAREALDEIGTHHPGIAIRVMTNLARILSLRMRETNAILRQLDDSRG